MTDSNTRQKIGFLEPCSEGTLLPAAIKGGLDLYAEYGYPVGGFLRAVLSNDFMDAIPRADPESLATIRAIAIYVYNALPGDCHGTREKYNAWVEKGKSAQRSSRGADMHQDERTPYTTD